MHVHVYNACLRGTSYTIEAEGKGAMEVDSNRSSHGRNEHDNGLQVVVEDIRTKGHYKETMTLILIQRSWALD